MKKLLLSAALSSTLVLTGCASTLMNPANDEAPKADENSSTVTFFRSAFMAGAIQAPIAEETNDGNVKFVGIASKGTKIKQRVSPGKHTYVVGGESSNLLEADLKANSNYYVRIEPHIGVWKARFTADAVTAEELQKPEIQKEIQDCQRVTVNEQGNKWFEENKDSMREKLSDAKQDYQKSSAEKKAMHTLKPEDGIAESY